LLDIVYRGIVGIGSSFVATNNEFTNLFRAMDVSGNTDPIHFEDNKIQYTVDFITSQNLTDPLLYAIRITNSDAGGSIYNNEVYCLSEELEADAVAIYAEDVLGLVIAGNEIFGFTDPIQCFDSEMSWIVKNEISLFQRTGILIEGSAEVRIYFNEITTSRILENVQMTGILLDECQDIIVDYNTINMEGIDKFENGYVGAFSQSVGIQCHTDGDVDDHIFMENCVNETGIALRFVQNTPCFIGEPPLLLAVPCTIPLIVNNYLYNYCEAGMQFEGNYTGNIGTNNTADEGGRNSFVSNYLPGPVDVFGAANDVVNTGVGTITLSGNSEVLFTTGAVDVQDNTITSTVSCGNYVGNNEEEQEHNKQANPMLFNLVFQKYYEEAFPIELNGYDYQLLSNYQSQMAQVATSSRLRYSSALYSILDNNSDNPDQAEALVNFVINASYLNPHDLHVFNHFVAKEKGDWDAAEAVLNSFAPLSQDDIDFLSLETLRIAIARGEAEATQLSENQQTMLADIDERRGLYAAPARDLLSMTTLAHDYIFTKYEDGDYSYTFIKNEMEQGTGLLVFPNPASTEITVIYNLMDGVTNAELGIFNIYGQQVFRQQLNAISSQANITLPSLASGIYVVNISNDGKSINSQKFVVTQ
jgi:hypothetical protein